jgi:Fe-S-cluster containining protein
MTHSESIKQRAHRSPDAQAKKRAQRTTRGAKSEGQATRPARPTRPIDKNRRDKTTRAKTTRDKPRKPRETAAAARTNAKASSDKLHLPVYGGASAVNTATKTRGRSAPSCTACGLCCSYVAIEIDSPATVKQATQLLWYVYHEGVSLYANDDEWMVQFDTTCIHLQPDYRCGIYETRPHICREFANEDCEINTGDDGKTFYTASEFMAHLKESRPRIYSFVNKHFAPPVEPQRTRLAPFEHRFQAVLSRRKSLGI